MSDEPTSGSSGSRCTTILSSVCSVSSRSSILSMPPIPPSRSVFVFFSSRRRHTRFKCDWSSDVCSSDLAFRPARVLMQDLTGVPAVVDLAAMRQAMLDLGGDPNKINPLSPVDLVIDHSVQIDNFGNPQAFANNVKIEFERNGERYRFLRWGQQAFENFRLVPPGTAICHQVNLEYLSQVVWTTEDDGRTIAYPDTLVGTDSHTTMRNALSVLRSA